MYTHNLDPVLIDFGVIAIRWYSSGIHNWNNSWLVAGEKNINSRSRKDQS